MTRQNPYRFTDRETSSYGFEYGSQEWLEGLDYPEKDRAEISRNRKMALKAGVGRPGADQIKRSTTPIQRIGPRGGAYTDAITKDGRPYRRYF
jgi:hypothetical protein